MGLGGITLARRRQVVELPPPPIEHRIYKGWCATCGKWREAPVDLGGQVMGQGRLGVRISSAIAYLRTIMRLPIRQIQAYPLDAAWIAGEHWGDCRTAASDQRADQSPGGVSQSRDPSQSSHPS